MPQPKCIALLLAFLLVLLPRAACAQAKLKIFDAHLHYNQEPNPFYPLEKVLEVFRRNDVGGIIANSRPNKGTHDLVTAKAQGLLVVPFIRPYRTRADVTDWSTDPSIYALIESEYQRGYFRGIGEFHIYGEAAARPLVKKKRSNLPPSGTFIFLPIAMRWHWPSCSGTIRQPRSSGPIPASRHRSHACASFSSSIRR